MIDEKQLKTTAVKFNVRDIVQIALGGCVMAFPAATTGEIWDLGTELALSRALLIAFASIFFLAVLIYALHHQGMDPFDNKVFLQRVISTYGVTLLISAALLFAIDRLDLLTDPLVGLKRTILVAFPASFAATVVDSFGSDNST